MSYVFDTHVHIYPFYDLARVLGTIDANLNMLQPEGTKIACLTERFDCHVYEDLASGEPDPRIQNFTLAPSATGDSIHVVPPAGGQGFYLLPGQQIITSENLEILSLGCRSRMEDGLPAEDTVREVIRLGGIPVAAWGFGKWFQKRGKVIARLIEQFAPAELAVGDSTMRPRGWTTPPLMKEAGEKGIRTLCGSDPLPFTGEEIRPGSYATCANLTEKISHPEEAIRYILLPETRIWSAGKRGSILEVASRLYNHKRSDRMSRA